MTTDQRRRDEAEIRGLIADWSRAVEAKDARAIVRDYCPDAVLFDAIPPARVVGAAAIGAIWAQCFPHFPEKFRSEHKDLVVQVDGEVAFAHGLHHFVPEPADHPAGATWMRVTLCFQRVEGRWGVVHEHVSVPFDPMTGRAAFIDDAGETFAAPAYGGCASSA